MVRSLEVGDDILTSAGIYGTIVALDDEIATLEVADGVNLRIARMAIGRRLNPHVDDRPSTDRGQPSEDGGEAERPLLPPPMEEQ
jgi:preprotein translocase subunit YajC